MKIGKKPSNNPSTKSTQITPHLDFIPYMVYLNEENHLAVRVRNGKHKQGAASISVELENSTIRVQRIDIHQSIKTILSKGNGEHLLDTFTAYDQEYEIFYTVKNKKLEPTIIVKKK